MQNVKFCKYPCRFLAIFIVLQVLFKNNILKGESNIMSELYKKYVSLKVQDCSKYYLFKNGFFYIFLDEDAKTMSNILHLKLGNLNTSIVKCGFPETSLNKYLSYLKSLNYDISVVPSSESTAFPTSNEYLTFSSLKKLSIEFCSIDVDNLSISEAFDTITNFQRQISTLLENEVRNNE